MTEETNTTEEVKDEGAAQAVEIFSMREDKADKDIAKAAKAMMSMDELPDNVKKLLEKKKSEKSDPKKKKRKKKVLDKKIPSGKAYVKATYNNTIVAITNPNGDVLSWASAGVAGFKGAKKSTPYAAQIITRIAVERAREFGITEVGVYVKGVGTGREAAVRALNACGLVVTYIRDLTPIAHNGCRAKKPRRV
jgi:small subunit ribosomal protein S11